MNNSDDNNQSQRLMPFRAVIPFYILYDLDLNANHLRLYGQIEQMESNPNPNVTASFSIKWLASQLNINERNTRKMVSVLIEKNYIEHKEISPGKWAWNTVKKPVQCQEKGGLPETGGDVAERQGGDVSQRHPKIPEDKIPKDNKKINIKKEDSFSFDQAQENNPHHINKELFTEWKQHRKKQITQRVWEKTNRVMTEITRKGIPGKEAFEIMLEKQWEGMEARYFEEEINYRFGNKTKERPGDGFSKAINKYLKNGTYDQNGDYIDPLR